MSRALIITDVQNDFCEGGTLAIAGGVDVAAGVSAALAGSAHDWTHVVATKDFHVDPGAHFGDPPDYVDSWPVHCLAGSSGSDFHPVLDVDRIEAVFVKGEHAAAYSGFEGHAGSISLAAWLRMHDVTEVDVVGLATDHCVRATAIDAVAEGFVTTVLLGLTAGVARETTESALAAMTASGARLVGTPVVRS